MSELFNQLIGSSSVEKLVGGLAGAPFIARLPIDWTPWADESPQSFTGVGIDASEDVARAKAASECLEVLIGTSPEALENAMTWATGAASDAERLGPHCFAAGTCTIDGTRPELRWCRGQGLQSQRDYLVPSFQAFVWNEHDVPNHDHATVTDGSGLAAGSAARDDSALVGHALAEVLERDACMLAWLSPNWKVRDISVGDLDDTWAGQLGERFEWSLLDVGEPGLWPVVLCLLFDREFESFTVGSACRPTAKHAGLHAVQEALMLRHAALEACSQAEVFVPSNSWEHVARASRARGEVSDWFASLARHECGALGPSLNPEDVVRRWEYGEPIAVWLEAAGNRVVRVLLPEAIRKQWLHCERQPHFTGKPDKRIAESLGEELPNQQPHPYG